jgi:hypothetical protein
MTKYINTYTELDKYLGNDFILFCGSAISAGANDWNGNFFQFLPMVNDATKEIFFLLGSLIDKSSYVGRILSRYSLEIASGKYKLKRTNQKFESFLWKLEQQLGGKNISELIKALYLCEAGQFLHNHQAISLLFNQGRIKLCLTTNFDNAIELANPFITKVVHKNKFAFPEYPTSPTLIKLHGDVQEGSFIATTNSLYTAEKSHSFQYIEDLLTNKIVLFAGYSGGGDIDIAPHLENAKKKGAKFVWLGKPNSTPPSFATYYCQTDLFSISQNDNCLLRLANWNGIDALKKGNFPPWKNRLKDWIGSFTSTIITKTIIEDVFGEISSWARFHMYQILEWEKMEKGYRRNKDTDLLDFSRKCLNVGIYYSGINAIEKIDRTEIKRQGFYEELLFNKGFINWRLVNLQTALNTLRYFIYLNETDYENYFNEWGLRVYVEVALDELRAIKSKRKAKNFYFDFHVDYAISKLITIVNKTNDPSNELFIKLISINIDKRLGEKNLMEELRNVYNRAKSIRDWGIAEASALSMLSITPAEGRNKFRDIHNITGGKWKWHSIKSYSLALLENAPKTIINISHLLFVFFSKTAVIIRELYSFYKQILWWIAYRLSRLIVE